ncbi:MAG: hypothetical protein ACJAZN_002222 [Planctomycetota bacterium]|jgi:hypothetical protein
MNRYGVLAAAQWQREAEWGGRKLRSELPFSATFQRYLSGNRTSVTSPSRTST